MGFADINVMRVNLTECQGAQSWNPSDRICRSVAIFVHHIESVVKCHCLACQRFKRVCVCVNCELETLTQFSLQGGTSLWSQAERKRHNRPYARSYIRVTCLACCCLCWAAEVQRNWSTSDMTKTRGRRWTGVSWTHLLIHCPLVHVHCGWSLHVLRVTRYNQRQKNVLVKPPLSLRCSKISHDVTRIIIHLHSCEWKTTCTCSKENYFHNPEGMPRQLTINANPRPFDSVVLCTIVIINKFSFPFIEV